MTKNDTRARDSTTEGESAPHSTAQKRATAPAATRLSPRRPSPVPCGLSSWNTCWGKGGTQRWPIAATSDRAAVGRRGRTSIARSPPLLPAAGDRATVHVHLLVVEEVSCAPRRARRRLHHPRVHPREQHDGMSAARGGRGAARSANTAMGTRAAHWRQLPISSRMKGMHRLEVGAVVVFRRAPTHCAGRRAPVRHKQKVGVPMSDTGGVGGLDWDHAVSTHHGRVHVVQTWPPQRTKQLRA